MSDFTQSLTISLAIQGCYSQRPMQDKQRARRRAENHDGLISMFLYSINMQGSNISRRTVSTESLSLSVIIISIQQTHLSSSSTEHSTLNLLAPRHESRNRLDRHSRQRRPIFQPANRINRLIIDIQIITRRLDLEMRHQVQQHRVHQSERKVGRNAHA